MRKNRYINLVFLFFVVILSCQQNQDMTRKNEALIIGEWYPVQVQTANSFPTTFYMTGYEFKENGICENKLGYYEYAKSYAFKFSTPYDGRNDWISTNTNYYLDNVVYSYGHTTCYTINDSILNIYNPSLRQYEGYKLEFNNTADTMILTGNLREEVYVRKNYEIKDSLLFDKIIFFYPYTKFFNKPKIFSISKNGDFYKFDCDTKSKDILYTNVLKEDFEKIEFQFRKAKFDTIADYLKNYYSKKDFTRPPAIFPDQSSARLTIVSNNKMFTVPDVFMDVDLDKNKDFFWAYVNGLFYCEQMRLEQSNESEISNDQQSIFSKDADLFTFRFLKKDSIINLYNTEAFHLVTSLNNAIVTDEDFIPEYILKDYLTSKNNVETDGRYFRYRKDKKTITLDLGYNFIKENELEKYLRKMDDYEEDISSWEHE